MSDKIDETGSNEGRVKKVKAAEGQRALVCEVRRFEEKKTDIKFLVLL